MFAPQYLRPKFLPSNIYDKSTPLITIILIPDKGPKYRTVWINTEQLATLNMKYVNRPPPLLDDLDPPLG